jgi:Caspase domain
MNKRLLARRFGKFPALSLLLFLSTAVHAEKRALLVGISHYPPPEGSTFPVEPGHASDSRFSPGTTWPRLYGPENDVAAIRLLLHENFGFDYPNITVLPEGEATHDGILAAIDRLANQTKPGDMVVFYYSGHGSRRLDTLSSKNQMDETIVPIDAWSRDPDVRDKELAVRFNRIVYDKHAHLTAIFDSCDSGTQARGAAAVLTRALPYDDRDVAKDKVAHPDTVVVESDLKHLPQEGDAIIIAAAGANESAVEARYPDDNLWHGAFTRALIRTLQSTSQSLSAEDVVASVSNRLEADHEEYRIDFQQASVEGRRQQSLFGAPVPPHPLHVRILAAPTPSSFSPVWKIDVGSAGGFEPGTQFTSLDPAPDGERSVLEVTSLDEPMVSSMKLVSGAAEINVGAVFELSKKVYPHASELAIFVSTPQPEPADGSIHTKSLFPGLKWVEDPSLEPIDYLVVEEDRGWVAYAYDGTSLQPGPGAKGNAYLVSGPPQSLIDQIKLYNPYRSGAFTFTHKLTEANYFLAMRTHPDSPAEFALFDPVVLASRKPRAFIQSAYHDSDEAELENGKSPEVVCRNDISMPVRTAWLPNKPTSEMGTGLSLAITRRIVRIGKLRFLLSSAAVAPALRQWPYRLAITQPGSDNPLPKIPLRPPQKYAVRLLASADVIAAHPPSPKYLYLIGFDCAANPRVLFPTDAKAGTGMLPEPVAGAYPASQLVYSIPDPGISGPFGADTIFLMATPAPQDPNVIIDDGDLTQGSTRGAMRGGFKDMNDFVSGLGNGTLNSEQADWTLQEIVVPSLP